MADSAGQHTGRPGAQHPGAQGGPGARHDGPPDWTEPGLFTVAPGVHRIPLPLPNDGLRAVNVYAIESGDDLVLVDAGWVLAETGGLLDAALDRIGRNSAEITRCLVTHVHRDHYTMAGDPAPPLRHSRCAGDWRPPLAGRGQRGRAART